MGKCSVENCNNECFEQEDKCILHCEKDDSFQSNDNNVKFFYYALIEYITPLVLRASKEYKISIGSIEHQKTIIWNFLDGLDNNDRTFDIKEALTNKITLKDIRFPINGIPNAQYNYDKVLNKLINIEFNNCYFNDDLSLNNYKNLTFRRCTFLGEWYHIFCNEIKYIECIFEDFIIDNISEDKLIVENHLLYYCGFKNIRCSGTRFKKRFFKFNHINKHKKIETIAFIYCEFQDDFILNDIEVNNDIFTINNIDLSQSKFEKKVKIQNCHIKGKANFENTSFIKLADFYKTEFFNNNFFKTDFKDISVFTEAVFHEKVDFKYTTFAELALFRKTKFEKTVDFEDAIFKEEANFLEINANGVANRETARIIKNSFEQQNNIIEANRFYAKEMKKREQELNKDILKGENILEWLIFKIHSISSDHSQSWFLTLLWIFIISIIFSVHKENVLLSKDLLLGSVLVGVVSSIVLYCNRELKYIKHMASLLILILLLVNYLTVINAPLDTLAKNISSLAKLEKELTFYDLIFKITIAYLLYQFIISVRQNTRRK